MEYTQEQLTQMIAEAVTKATKGMYSEEEFNRKLTAEVDRRVESGIQKGLETQKTKWEKEFAEKAQLSAEELAKKELQEQLGLISSKEKEISKRANLIEAKEFLSEAGIPKSYYEKFTGMLVSDDAEVTKSNVTNFIDMFSKTKQDIETKVKSEFSNIPAPKQGASEGVSKEDFQKMTYSEKLKIKTEQPELFKKFMG